MFICLRSVIRWYRTSSFTGSQRWGEIRFFLGWRRIRRTSKKNKLLFYNRNSIDLTIILKLKGKPQDLVTVNYKSRKATSSDLSLSMGFLISIIKTMILPQFGRNCRIYIRIIDLMKHSASVKASKTHYFSMILTLNWISKSTVWSKGYTNSINRWLTITNTSMNLITPLIRLKKV